MKKKIIGGILSLVISCNLSLGVYGQGERIQLTLDQALESGLAKSPALARVKTEIKLAEIKKKRGAYGASKLRKGEKDLREASRLLGQLTGLPGLEEEIASLAQAIENGEENLLEGLAQASMKIRDNLDFDSLDLLGLEASAELLEAMSSGLHDLTVESYSHYENQLGLVIRKTYFDGLRARRAYENKLAGQARVERGLEILRARAEKGQASPGELEEAQAYLRTKRLEVERARTQYENAKLDLKREACLDLDLDLDLVDLTRGEPEAYDLKQGLAQGLIARLEVRQALGQVLIQTRNFEHVKGSYTPNTFQYQEARELVERARADYGQAKLVVGTSIRQAYNQLESAGALLEESKGLREAAEARLLALKDQGSVDQAIGAEEDLAQLEELLGDLIYGYDLARVQYKNSIGDYLY